MLQALGKGGDSGSVYINLFNANKFSMKLPLKLPLVGISCKFYRCVDNLIWHCINRVDVLNDTITVKGEITDVDIEKKAATIEVICTKQGWKEGDIQKKFRVTCR